MNPFQGEGVALHLRQKDAVVLISLSVDASPSCVRIAAGFENLDTCLQQVADCLKQKNALGIPVYLCISGTSVQYFLSRVPHLNANMVIKAFRLQMKQQLGEEPASLQSVPLWTTKTEGGDLQGYLVAATKKGLRDQVYGLFKKYQLKMGGWDVDLLAYYRASDFLWRRAQADESSRFIINLEKDNCQLILISTQGQIISSNLAIGAEQFRKQIEQINEIELSSGQSLNGIYLPLINQVKTQLYATCNEFGIPLPSHFILLGAGTNLPNLTETCVAELNLAPIQPDQNFPWETIVAVGLLLQRKGSNRVNFFPSKRKLAWKALINSIKRIKLKAPKLPQVSSISSGLDFGPGIWIGGAVIAAILLSGIPLFTRSRAKNRLAAEQRDYANAQYYKNLIEKSEKREKEFQRRSTLVNLIGQKKYMLSRAMQEVISIIPPTMKLQGVHFKGDTLTIKGYGSSHTEIQTYLKKALDFKYLAEPVPLAMQEGTTRTNFEILFKMRI